MDYSVYNKFQTEFYTSVERFRNNSNFTIRQYSFLLLNSIMKGFPQLADQIINIYSPHVKAIQSPAIILALQHRFINGFSSNRIPSFVYYKQGKQLKEKVVKKRLKKNEVVPIVFDSEVVEIIKSQLQYDTKTYEYLKFNQHIQNLGIELTKTLYNKKTV